MNRKSILLLFVSAMLLIGVIGVYANEFSVKVDVDTPQEKVATSTEIDGKYYFSVEDMKEVFAMEYRLRLNQENEKSIVLQNEFYDLEFTDVEGISHRTMLDVHLGEDSNYIVHEGKYYIPVFAVAKAMSYGISVDSINQTLYLLSNNRIFEIVQEEVHEEVHAFGYEEYNFDEEDKLWLARIATIEAMDGSVLKKLAVVNVVLNRVKSDRFPNTPYEVIFQKGQFPPAHRKSFQTLIPSAEAVEAVERALRGENNVDECLFFNMVKFKSKSDDELFGNIEGDYFYY